MIPACSRRRLELGDRPLDVRLATDPSGVEQLCQLAEAFGLEGLEGEVLELPLHLPDPQPLGERRVDLHRLAGDPLLLLGRQPVERPHVVEPVGELDQDDPDVLGHRQEHLPDVLGLLLLVAVGAELGQLGDAVDELGDLGAELLLDVGQAVLGVLGDVVEQRRLDRDRIDPELGEDLRRRDGMRDVRLARPASLALVRRDGKVECRADRVEVDARVLLEDRREEVCAQRLEIGARAALAMAAGSGVRGPRPLPFSAGGRGAAVAVAAFGGGRLRLGVAVADRFRPRRGRRFGSWRGAGHGPQG